jgi:flavodoxin
MKHESIVVVYDSCQAVAEEIADKLGAETISVQSMNNRQVENSQSLVLAVEFQADGLLTPHWQYASQMLRTASLNGKNIAVFIALGNRLDNGSYANAFCSGLKENGARLVGDQPYAGTQDWNLDNWVCAISPNL